ncbi:hypothetical protein FRC17_000250 [Serendipita sp. 399]|nr:hypothetical protein FRC17_000250 [Serendipita sp. 399]
MSSFSFLPLPSAASTTPSKNIQERSKDATDRHTRAMDSKAAQNNVQNIPFGYNPVENMGQRGSRIRDEAPFLGASSSRTSPDDPIRAQDPHRSPDIPSPNISIPLYFHPMHGAGGLVCGIEESTKFGTLTNLLTSSWSAAADQSMPKELLCFTAENGSLGLVASLNAAAQAPNVEPEIIVLTPYVQ